MTHEEFIQALLTGAQGIGIAEAEVYYQRSESMHVYVDKGDIDEYAVNTSGGFLLRGLVDGKMGAAYSEAVDREAVIMLVRSVLESAALINDRDEQFIFDGKGASYAQVDSGGDWGTPQERIALALQLDEIGRSADPHVGKLGRVVVQTERETVRIVNTHGLDLSHVSDACVGYVNAIARQGERVSTGSAVEATVSLASLSAERIARRAVEEAVLQLGASPCEGGEMPVILRNTAMADLLGAFSGVFSAEAAQKGLSLLKGKEGEAIAAPCVTLVDDPLLAGGLYSRGFDAEGVPTRTKNVIESGTLQTLLHNLKTARKAKCQSTGNASRSGYAGAVGIAPFNFFIQPGEKDLATLEAEMSDGLVITDVEGLHAGTNAVSGDFSLLAKGYLVRDGMRARAVEQVTVSGNFFQVLKDITAIGNDMRWELGRVRSPSVRVSALAVAGK